MGDNGNAGHDLVKGQAARWRRVAKAMKTRREELRLTQADVVARSDRLISGPVYGILERAEQSSYRRRVLVGACRGLGWSDDSIERIVAGQNPRPTSPSHSSDASFDLRTMETTLRDLVGQVTRLDELVREALGDRTSAVRRSSSARRAS